MLCHMAFVRDTIRRLSSFAGRCGATLVLATTPSGETPWLESLADREGIEAVDQGGGHLGARMRRVLALDAAGSSRRVVVGSDSPDLPLDLLELAFSTLAEKTVVLIPAQDGGYCLVGCSAEVPRIFDLRSGWGGGRVLAETIEMLEKHETSYGLLPPWYDVDDHDSLRQLVRRIEGAESGGEEGALMSTRAMVARLGEAGIVL